MVIIMRKKLNLWKPDLNGDLAIHLAARKFNISEIRALIRTVNDNVERENLLLMKNKFEESTVDILKK